MTLYDFLREHESAKIEVSEYGRPLAMFNSQGIKDYETSIRADERRRFAEWLAHNHKYNPMKEDIGFAWSDNAHFSTVDEVIAEYEKEQKGEQNADT